MEDLREGMAAIVAQLRKYGQASRDDEFNGETYWTDGQLQDIADTRSERLLVSLLPVLSSNRTIFTIKAPRTYWFEDGLFGVLQIKDDNTILNVTTPRSYNAQRGELTFSEPLDSRYSYAIEGTATNINLALADLWEQKMAQRFDYTDFKAGNNKVSMQQEFEHCKTMMQIYRNRIVRSVSYTTSGRWAR